MSSKKVTQYLSDTTLGGNLKILRDQLGLNQRDFARLIGVTSGAITHWETSRKRPSPMALMSIGKLPGADKAYWFAQAGPEYVVRQVRVDTYLAEEKAEEDGRKFPVLRDAAAAGTPRALDENEIDFHLSLPPQLVPRGGQIYGLKVEGSSMSPLLETGYIALVDVSKRDAKALVNSMVAARDGDGVTLKWLRKQSDDLYLLVPQNTSQRHQIQVMKHKGEWSVVGEVVMWIGQPPPKRSRK